MGMKCRCVFRTVRVGGVPKVFWRLELEGAKLHGEWKVEKDVTDAENAATEAAASKNWEIISWDDA